MTRGQPGELVDQHGRKYLTADERQRFLAAVRAHPKPAVQTLARTLTLTLRVCDVDLEAFELRIETLKRRTTHWRGVIRRFVRTITVRTKNVLCAGEPDAGVAAGPVE